MQLFLTIPVPILDEEKKINKNFSFHSSLWCLIEFSEIFEALQRSVKTKI